MRISLTGASSTGKTTLAMALLANKEFSKFATKIIHVDGRKLLIEMGCQSMDSMSREQQKSYQLNYYNKKVELEEININKKQHETK